jgi:hydroxypyruvate isomerase
MVKITVCVEMVFSGPFLERLAKVSEAGVSAFEFWGWSDKDVEAIDRRRRELGLTVTSFIVQPQPASLTAPNVTEEFRKAVRSTLDIAHKLECRTIIAPVGLGQEIAALGRDEQLGNAVRHLRAVAPLLEGADTTLVVEPVNPIDHKGCFLTKCEEGFQLIRSVNSPNVKLLYDFYHQQISEGNLIDNARRGFDLIGFFHVGDVPGRHEPGTGEINYRNVFKFLDDQGYAKHVSLEFMPTIDPVKAVRNTVLMAKSVN